MILGDKPLIFEVVLSQEFGWFSPISSFFLFLLTIVDYLFRYIIELQFNK
jgi:hypothetical protein